MSVSLYLLHAENLHIQKYTKMLSFQFLCVLQLFGCLVNFQTNRKNLSGRNCGEAKFRAVIFPRGEITGGEITGGEITGDEITCGEITGGEITGGEITGDEITGGEITCGEITGGEITGHDYNHNLRTHSDACG